MKLLILIAISIVSSNAFSAAELGENQKGECPFLIQSDKRDAKVVEATEAIKSDEIKSGSEVKSK